MIGASILHGLWHLIPRRTIRGIILKDDDRSIHSPAQQARLGPCSIPHSSVPQTLLAYAKITSSFLQDSTAGTRQLRAFGNPPASYPSKVSAREVGNPNGDADGGNGNGQPIFFKRSRLCAKNIDRHLKSMKVLLMVSTAFAYLQVRMRTDAGPRTRRKCEIEEAITWSNIPLWY
ncbi:unnamed protein product [Sphagnum troendelagicum]|uniref:Cytochrome c oxidase subunit 1 n=1 Tax=Sphagnum troendelagicum TaxID=128251 RepID=A0ABP0UQR0_9BRYO